MLSIRRFGHPLEVQVPRTLKAMAGPELYTMVIQERRVVELPYCGVKANALVVAVGARVRVVSLAQDEDGAAVLDPEFGVPAPVIVMPIFDGTVIPLVQVHEPDGIWITSPSTAVCAPPTQVPPLPLMQAFTSPTAQEFAV